MQPMECRRHGIQSLHNVRDGNTPAMSLVKDT